jgi:hypothetical protein
VRSATTVGQHVTNQIAEQAERAGGWPILKAIEATQKTGQDWRPEAARLRELNTDNWRRTRCMLCTDGTETPIASLPSGRPRAGG